jgi:protocatechuate 3,4-dioxygenase beta subunit
VSADPKAIPELVAMPPVYRRFGPGTQPEYLVPDYASTRGRAPKQPLVRVPQTLSEMTGPRFGRESLDESVVDMTKFDGGLALGERIVVGGQVTDEDGRPVRDALIEVWQCNASGRYVHANDQHDAPLDPHFSGLGAAVTDGDGRYRFLTIKPGAYPWRNHHNAWRPAHIHLSLFGNAYAQRLVTQMYFPGDPLLAFDPIFKSTADEGARERLVSAFDWEATSPEYALGYRFDIVLRGRERTPFEDDHA